MTAYDIINIVTLVAGTQLACDYLARKLIFSKEPYQRAVSAFQRAKTKRDKLLEASSSTTSSNSSANKSKANQSSKSTNAEAKAAKKMQRAEDDLKEAAASIATRHTSPGFFASIAFLILYRILSIEYSGKVIAILPFQPWGIVRRLTMKGFQFNSVEEAAFDGTGKVTDPSQACSFMFIYALSTISVKFVMNKLFGVQPPKGADQGMTTLLDAPQSQKALQSLGVDTDELNEVRKAF